VLHVAAMNGHQAIAQLLLEQCADISTTDDDGWTALDLAAQNGHEAVVELLLEQGTDIYYG
jgi:ankyrin repeat protein